MYGTVRGATRIHAPDFRLIRMLSLVAT